jgi:DNA-binding response OmpR family regulator
MLEKSLTPGYDVLTATDADQAIDLFRVGGDAIELVLLDLGMPGMSGCETLAELQLIDADVKVVIISLDPDEERLPGVAKILAKPFRPAQVVDAVQGVIGV